MFITKQYIERIKSAYKHAQLGGFKPDVLAPLITINCYTSGLLLEKFNLHGPWFQNIEIARFFWGKGNIFHP